MGASAVEAVNVSIQACLTSIIARFENFRTDGGAERGRKKVFVSYKRAFSVPIG